MTSVYCVFKEIPIGSGEVKELKKIFDNEAAANEYATKHQYPYVDNDDSYEVEIWELLTKYNKYD